MFLVANAQSTSDVANTPHNLSVDGPGTVRATSETQVCVFCHTPHGATNSPGTPLWNRALSGQTYTTYSSSSLDAATIAGQLDQPAGSSKLCLSCHDGTLAISSVNVLGGQTSVSVAMTGLGPGDTMPPGEGVQTGFTRNLGTDLSNDHPISLTYDTTLTLATTDGELRDPAVEAHIAIRAPGVRPPVPLEGTGPAGDAQVQCATCHDPHVINPDNPPTNKFLRLNRFDHLGPCRFHRSHGDLPGRSGTAQGVSARPAGLAGRLPELPRHAQRAWFTPVVARGYRCRGNAQIRRQFGDRGNLLPVSLRRTDRHQRGG
jgi:hypothetical protein